MELGFVRRVDAGAPMASKRQASGKGAALTPGSKAAVAMDLGWLAISPQPSGGVDDDLLVGEQSDELLGALGVEVERG